jgi:GT2 family glycosyltransferase
MPSVTRQSSPVTNKSMDLSVIIVNYNVKYFLEQCLHAVLNAAGKLAVEIFVVDNNSADGSVQMITEKFPQVKLICNTVNAGFARANNQAIKQAAGKYILLLNPDTVVQEDTFAACIGYMENNPDAGCLGVKMIDGKGNYLPESKRALPTPIVAFYKVFGLSALFPRSSRFGRYHLSYLNPEKIHEVDVISGAFMLIRKSVLEQTGLLDEEFFMYGEDIDMSYRIRMAGYRNIYFPKTTIIHYKGESTKKSSINYVLVFYRAMIIFARKHFKQSTFRYYSFIIHLAIYFRAGISIISRFITGIITPVMDGAMAYGGYRLLLPVWEKYHFGYTDYYPPEFMKFVVPAYILVWLFAIFISTGYEKRVKLTDLVRGVLMGTLIILVIYALLPENWRFSRALILLGTIWLLFSTISIRYLLHRVNKNIFSFEFSKKKKRIIIIGDMQECGRVYSIISQTQVVPDLVGFVDPESTGNRKDFIGHLDHIEEIVRINQADELVFCAATVSSQQIIRTMLQFTDTGLEFKIAPPESLSVIGSNSHDASGELYVLHFNTLSRILNRRKKRMFDIGCSVMLILMIPIALFIVRKPFGLIRNIFSVMLGFYSWVGYYRSTGGEHPGLPRIKPGILTPIDLTVQEDLSKAFTEQVNLSYAKDYRINNDLKNMISNFNLLGREPAIYKTKAVGKQVDV